MTFVALEKVRDVVGWPLAQCGRSQSNLLLRITLSRNIAQNGVAQVLGNIIYLMIGRAVFMELLFQWPRTGNGQCWIWPPLWTHINPASITNFCRRLEVRGSLECLCIARNLRVFWLNIRNRASPTVAYNSRGSSAVGHRRRRNGNCRYLG